MSPLGTKSNWRMQASYRDAVIANDDKAGSPAVLLFVLARKDSGPLAWIALPLVSIIPLSIVSGVLLEMNVPFATPAHVRVGDIMLMPGPASFAANIAAG